MTSTRSGIVSREPTPAPREAPAAPRAASRALPADERSDALPPAAPRAISRPAMLPLRGEPPAVLSARALAESSAALESAPPPQLPRGTLSVEERTTYIVKLCAFGLPERALKPGNKGPNVAALQRLLKGLGLLARDEKIDGIYGSRTAAAVKKLKYTLIAMGYKDLGRNGVFGRRALAVTRRILLDDGKADRPAVKKLVVHALRMRSYVKFAPGTQYAPGTAKCANLFEAACRMAGLPVSWADPRTTQGKALLWILGGHNGVPGESHGWVGIPNYTFPYELRSKRPEGWIRILRDLRADGDFDYARVKSTATGLGQLLNYNVEAYYPSGRRGLGVPLEEAIGMLRYIEQRYGTPANGWAFKRVHHWY